MEQFKTTSTNKMPQSQNLYKSKIKDKNENSFATFSRINNNIHFYFYCHVFSCDVSYWVKINVEHDKGKLS